MYLHDLNSYSKRKKHIVRSSNNIFMNNNNIVLLIIKQMFVIVFNCNTINIIIILEIASILLLAVTMEMQITIARRNPKKGARN